MTQLTVTPLEEPQVETEDRSEESQAASESQALLQEAKTGQEDKSPVWVALPDGQGFCERRAKFSANNCSAASSQVKPASRREREKTPDQTNPSLVLPRLWAVDVS